MAKHLAAHSFRLCGLFPDAPELRGSLYGSGFAFQYAGRAQALPKMLLRLCWLFTAFLGSMAMVTNVLTSALSVCRKGAFQGSVSGGSYEAPQSFAPREYDSVLGDVVGMSASAWIVNVKDGRALPLCSRIGRAAPGAGESRFVFPSDCFEWSRRDDASDVRD